MQNNGVLTQKNIWGVQKMSGVQKQKGVCAVWESEDPLWHTQYFFTIPDI